ncbi:MAG: hypothetical protein AAF938_09995 [Myxococcota bacterium]
MHAPPLWAVDLALGAVAFETLGLIAYRRFRGGGLALPDIFGQLLAGALLLAALRTAWAGMNPLITLGLLGASLPAHLFDLHRRTRAAHTPSS